VGKPLTRSTQKQMNMKTQKYRVTRLFLTGHLAGQCYETTETSFNLRAGELGVTIGGDEYRVVVVERLGETEKTEREQILDAVFTPLDGGAQ